MNTHNKEYIYMEDILKTFITLMIATLLCFSFVKVTDIRLSVDVIYILAVVVISRITSGYIWGIIASILGVIGVNYYFTYPYFEINFIMNGYPLTFLSMLIISIIISTMTVNIKKQMKLVRDREEKAQKLREISNSFLAISEVDEIINLTLEYAVEISNCSSIFYLYKGNNKKKFINALNIKEKNYLNNSNEELIADWVYKHNMSAGYKTRFFNNAHCTYIPIASQNTVLGVIGLCNKADLSLDKSVLTFLELITSEVSMTLERLYLSEKQKYLAIETEKEKMKANLLRAISHDLRTPLTAIIGASSILLEDKCLLNDNDERNKLIKSINEDSNWLLNMVENLLSVTRINETNATVSKTLEPLEEVVSESIMRLKKRYPYTNVLVKIPDEFIMIPMDATLIEQVILNLIENSIKHSKSTKPIRLIVKKNDNKIIFNIVDNGIGLNADNIDNIFDGYSLNENSSSDSSKGMGIGLSICKTIIKAHGGDILAKNNLNGGSTFSFSLPLEGDNMYE